MHDDDIWFRGGEPCGQLVLVGELGRKGAAVAFAVAVEGETAVCRARSGSDRVEVGEAGVFEFLPEVCAPAALEEEVLALRSLGAVYLDYVTYILDYGSSKGHDSDGRDGSHSFLWFRCWC